MARRIKKAEIEFISLVPKGANKFRSIYKSDGSCELTTLSKLNDQGELTAVVYAPEHRDSQGDIADAHVIKDAARGFIAKGAKIDIRHDGKPVGADKAYVAESFIIHKGDDRFEGWHDTDGNPVDLTGGWATVIQLEDQDLREKYRSGEWNGVSMGGTAIVEQEKHASVDDLAAALTKALTSARTQTQSPEEDDMTPEQLAELKKSMTDSIKEVGVELAKALKPAAPEAPAPAPAPAPETPTEKKAPVFKGDISDGNAVRRHSLELQLFNLEKALDFTDAEAVEAFLEDSEEIRKELDELKATTSKKTIRKAGNSAGGSDHSNRDSQFAYVGKSHMDALAEAMQVADALNEQRYGKGV